MKNTIKREQNKTSLVLPGWSILCNKRVKELHERPAIISTKILIVWMFLTMPAVAGAQHNTLPATAATDTIVIMARLAAGITRPMPPMKIAIKTNLLYGIGTLTPNLALEAGLGRRSTLELTGYYNNRNRDGSDTDNKKLVHWIVQPEYRYWFCERFNGHFIGIHALYGRYNISGYKLPQLFGKDSGDYRHEGDIAGGGVSYGYQLMLGKRWNMEFNIGAGYGHMTYDRYACPKCGGLKDKYNRRDYFGPTKAGICLIYLIK